MQLPHELQCRRCIWLILQIEIVVRAQQIGYSTYHTICLCWLPDDFLFDDHHPLCCSVIPYTHKKRGNLQVAFWMCMCACECLCIFVVIFWLWWKKAVEFLPLNPWRVVTIYINNDKVLSEHEQGQIMRKETSLITILCRPSLI